MSHPTEGGAPLRPTRDVVEFRTRELPLFVAAIVGAVPLLIAAQLLVSCVVAVIAGLGASMLPSLAAAVVFAMLGAAPLLLRRSAIVDRSARTLTVRWGRGLTLSRRTWALDPAVVTFVDPIKITRGYVWRCFILDTDGAKQLVWESPFEEQAQRVTASLAAFLQGEEPWPQTTA